MKTKFCSLLAIAALGLCTTIASADPVECATDSSGDFVDGTTLGLTSVGSCTLGDTTFSNFTVFAATGFSLTDPSMGAFSMTIYVDPTIDALEIDDTGLSGSEDIHLTFQGAIGVTNITLLAGAASTVSESITSGPCNISAATCSGTVLNTTPLSASNSGSSFSLVTYASTDYFFDDISGGSSTIEEIAAPEPMTFSLIGLGFLGLGLLSRRLRS
jgi:hypothetical protein